MCKLLETLKNQNDTNAGLMANEALSKTDDPNVVTIGTSGRVARFRSRPTKGDTEAGYIRLTVDGKETTISGYVPRYGRGGKVFYANGWGKNAGLAG